MMFGCVRTATFTRRAPPSTRSKAISIPEQPGPTTSASSPRNGSGLRYSAACSRRPWKRSRPGHAGILLRLSEWRTVRAAWCAGALRRTAPDRRPWAGTRRGSYSPSRRLIWCVEALASKHSALSRGSRWPTFRSNTWLHRAQGLELLRGQGPLEDLSCALTQETGQSARIRAGKSERRRHDRRREGRGIVAVGKDELVRMCANPEAYAATSPAVCVLDGENRRELPGGQPRVALVPSPVDARELVACHQMDVRAYRRA